MRASTDRLPLLLALLVGTIIALALSGWRPYDRLTWLMEVAPVLVTVAQRLEQAFPAINGGYTLQVAEPSRLLFMPGARGGTCVSVGPR